MFPAQRFREAGATDAEVEAMVAHFDALSPEVQAATAERYASIGTGDLGELLDAHRAIEGADGTLESAPVLEPEQPPAEPELPPLPEPAPEPETPPAA